MSKLSHVSAKCRLPLKQELLLMDICYSMTLPDKREEGHEYPLHLAPLLFFTLPAC